MAAKKRTRLTPEERRDDRKKKAKLRLKAKHDRRLSLLRDRVKRANTDLRRAYAERAIVNYQERLDRSVDRKKAQAEKRAARRAKLRGEEAPKAEMAKTEPPKKPATIADMNATDAIALIRTMDSVEELDNAQELEANGKERSTVLEAINLRWADVARLPDHNADDAIELVGVLDAEALAVAKSQEEADDSPRSTVLEAITKREVDLATPADAVSRFNVPEAVNLIELMETKPQLAIAVDQEAADGSPRKTVMEAIEKRLAEIKAAE